MEVRDRAAKATARIYSIRRPYSRTDAGGSASVATHPPLHQLPHDTCPWTMGIASTLQATHLEGDPPRNAFAFESPAR